MKIIQILKKLKFRIYQKESAHSYGTWITTKKATCTSNGTEQRKCNLCGKTETRTIKATGHKYTNKTIAPTITEKGYTLHTCSTCGYSYKDNYTNVKKQLQSITVSTKPSKTTYSVNDAIDTSGMKIVATYTDGSKTEVSGWKINGALSRLENIMLKSHIQKVALQKSLPMRFRSMKRVYRKRHFMLPIKLMVVQCRRQSSLEPRDQRFSC